MDYRIVSVKSHPLFRPSQSQGLLQRTLRTVQRWEDPIEAELEDLERALRETQEIVKWALGPIFLLPDGNKLQDEILAVWTNSTSIPPKALAELEELSSRRLDKARASHLRLLIQCHFLEGGRRQIRATEKILTDRAFIDSISGQAVTTQLRGLSHTTYERLTERGIDGRALDSMLDTRPVDLVAWLFEQRLYQALKAMYGIEWFRRNGLTSWFGEQQYVEKTQDSLPAQPIGDQSVLYTDLAALQHAVFDTQLKAAALFGSLSLNWHVGAEELARLLICVKQNATISERGSEKLVAALGLALEPANKGKFDKVCQSLMQGLRNALG